MIFFYRSKQQNIVKMSCTFCAHSICMYFQLKSIFPLIDCKVKSYNNKVRKPRDNEVQIKNIKDNNKKGQSYGLRKNGSQ